MRPLALSLSPRDRRMLIGGTCAVGCIIAFGKGIPTVNRWQHARTAEALDIREQLIAARSGTSSLSAISDSVKARGRRLETIKASLLGAATVETAASALAALVESTAAEVDVDVLSVALKPDSVVRSGLARVSVRLSAECDVQGLMDFLYEVETNRVPLVVRELSLTQGDALAPPSRMESLRFDAVIETLARIAPRTPRPPPAMRPPHPPKAS